MYHAISIAMEYGCARNRKEGENEASKQVCGVHL